MYTMTGSHACMWIRGKAKGKRDDDSADQEQNKAKVRGQNNAPLFRILPSGQVLCSWISSQTTLCVCTTLRPPHHGMMVCQKAAKLRLTGIWDFPTLVTGKLYRECGCMLFGIGGLSPGWAWQGFPPPSSPPEINPRQEADRHHRQREADLGMWKKASDGRAPNCWVSTADVFLNLHSAWMQNRVKHGTLDRHIPVHFISRG